MDYKCIEELHEIKVGRFIKWIRLPNKKWNSGFVIKVEMDESVRLIVKKGNYLTTCIVDESIIYQKLSIDEQLIKKIETLL